jgi:uncharacterized protein (UPF0276 family)
MKKKAMGLGYRAPFYSSLIHGHPEISWLEVITENYLWDKGVRRSNLLKLREHYDIALHGVSLSLAAPEEHDRDYLLKLKSFADEISPVRISDHLCWSSLGGHHWHDLLPFPYTQENLNHISKKVEAWQDILKRPLILENLSAYLSTSKNEMSEYEFLGELVKKTDCEILLDVNNMIVNARNFNIDPYKELRHINLDKVAQIHLAGFTETAKFVIDTHSEPPHEATWELWAEICSRKKNIPFMIEWDSDIPDFEAVKKYLDRAYTISEGRNERMV